MLTLPITKKWYDMINEGVKKEEYRAINEFYNASLGRFVGKTLMVKFRNGYDRSSPMLTCKCNVRIGTGKKEWGAENKRSYYILDIEQIIRD
jgi:hypothetical protein